jgi:hypothetical protein
MRAITISFLLSAASQVACFANQGNFGEAQTFVISSLEVPSEADLAFAPRDFDGDGSFDNSLPDWLSMGTAFDLDLQAQLTEQVNSGNYLFGILLRQDSESAGELNVFRADALGPLLFDGSDELINQENFPFLETSFINNQVTATGATLEWSLFPFGVGEVLTVPLRDARVESSVSENELRGSLTGFIDVLDAARLLEQVPAMFDALLVSDSLAFGGGAAVSCDGNVSGDSATCLAIEANSFCSDNIEDSVATGVCVSRETTSRRLLQFLDVDNDGHWSVDFNESTLSFDENELALLFTINPGNLIPSGILGQLFNLDANDDGDFDAMPLGIEFTAVPAILPQD